MTPKAARSMCLILITLAGSTIGPGSRPGQLSGVWAQEASGGSGGSQTVQPNAGQPDSTESRQVAIVQIGKWAPREINDLLDGALVTADRRDRQTRGPDAGTRHLAGMGRRIENLMMARDARVYVVAVPDRNPNAPPLMVPVTSFRDQKPCRDSVERTAWAIVLPVRAAQILPLPAEQSEWLLEQFDDDLESLTSTDPDRLARAVAMVELKAKVYKAFEDSLKQSLTALAQSTRPPERIAVSALDRNGGSVLLRNAKGSEIVVDGLSESDFRLVSKALVGIDWSQRDERLPLRGSAPARIMHKIENRLRADSQVESSVKRVVDSLRRHATAAALKSVWEMEVHRMIPENDTERLFCAVSNKHDGPLLVGLDAELLTATFGKYQATLLHRRSVDRKLPLPSNRPRTGLGSGSN